MSTLTRTLTRITVGLTALLFTGLGPTAFAALPVPDPTSAYDGGSDRGHPVSGVSGTPPVQHHAEASASGVSTVTVLLIVAVAILLTMLFAQGRRVRTARAATA